MVSYINLESRVKTQFQPSKNLRTAKTREIFWYRHGGKSMNLM
jgi:hypothetical protein